MKKLNLIIIIVAVFLSALPLNAQNYCLDFDGVDDNVRIEALGAPSTTDVTIEMWFNWQDAGADNTVDFLISHRLEVLEIHTGGALNNALRFIPRTGIYLDTPADVITKNTWHHLAFVYSSAGTAHCYIDGEEVTLTNNGASFDYINYINTDPVLIGTRINNGNYFTGMIDDVRMWSTARTQAQIQDNMRVELTGSESGLYKYYKMNEGFDLLTYNSAEAGSGDLINMDDTDWVISTAPFLPVVQSLLPIDNSTGILLDSNFEITFDMNVTAGSGSVIIYKSSDDSIVETISASSCAIIDSIVTINPSNDFDLQTDYYVLIDSTAFMRSDSLYFKGILDKTVWDFKAQNYFTDITAGLEGVFLSSVAWGDYDSDGDLDILLTGGNGSSSRISRIYNNDSGIFTDIAAGLPGIEKGSAVWGDYDNDGDLDILLTGSGISSVYRNDGNDTFTDIVAGLAGVSYSRVAWGDYDNDGDLDILLTGSGTSRIYHNNSGSFSDIGAGLAGIIYGSVDWGDYDNDGDLDILLTGSSISTIYQNNSLISNTIPLNPESLITKIGNDSIKLSWNKTTDNETPQDGLSYNIDIVIDGSFLKPGMSDTLNGYRKVVEIGNTNQNTYFNIGNSITDLSYLLPQEVNKNFSWRVQAIDNSFAGSEYASVDTAFISMNLDLITYNEMEASDLLRWEYIFEDSILNYQLQLDDDINFGSPIEEIILLSKKSKRTKGTTTYFEVALNELVDFDSLISDTKYYWRVKPNYFNFSSRYSATVPSFIYDPTYSTPSPVNIELSGEFVTISWNTAKDTTKGEVYNVYSTNDPYAVFPDGWSYEATVNGTQWLTMTSELKKFYCVTATSGKEEDVEMPIHRVSK